MLSENVHFFFWGGGGGGVKRVRRRENVETRAIPYERMVVYLLIDWK